MSAPFAIEYTSDGIATAKEAWYVEESTQQRETLESAEKLSSVVQEARRRQLARELAEGLREVLAEHKRLNEDRDLELKFRRLADEWITETGLLSDPVQKFMHPAHLKIIGMGEKALPFILKEVEKMSGHWFVALDAISPVNPVPPQDETNLQQVAQAWIEWGKHEGLI